MPRWPRPARCSSGCGICPRGSWSTCCWPPALFADLGYGQVWARMIAGLGGLRGGASRHAAALAQARRRIGVAPLRALFDLLRGPAAGLSVKGVRWRGRLVTAIDGTILGCPDTPANLAVYHRGGGYQGGTGYPLVRVLALVACGTRTIIDATFGTDRIGETSYAHDLLGALHRGMIVLADRNFAARDLLAAVADTGADLLVRVKIGRQPAGLPPAARPQLPLPHRRARGPRHHRHDHRGDRHRAPQPRSTG